MGRSEYGFYLPNRARLQKIIEYVNFHNSLPDLLGEHLYFGGILTYRNKYYLYLVNHGGREISTEFFLRNMKEETAAGEIYYPFDKPGWWSDNRNYIWEGSSKEDMRPPLDILPN